MGAGCRQAGLARREYQAQPQISAAAKLQRAALYYITAERMQGPGHANRVETFAKGQAAFREAIAPGKDNCVRVEIPYESAFMPGLLSRASARPEEPGTMPCVLYVNGLDSCKELLYWSGLPHALARRGSQRCALISPVPARRCV